MLHQSSGITVGFADFRVKITKRSFRLMCGVGPLAGTVPLVGERMRIEMPAAVRASSGESVKSEPATSWYLVCQRGWEFWRSLVGK